MTSWWESVAKPQWNTLGAYSVCYKSYCSVWWEYKKWVLETIEMCVPMDVSQTVNLPTTTMESYWSKNKKERILWLVEFQVAPPLFVHYIAGYYFQSSYHQLLLNAPYAPQCCLVVLHSTSQKVWGDSNKGGSCRPTAHVFVCGFMYV